MTSSSRPASDLTAALDAAVRSGAMQAGAVGLITKGRVTTIKAAGEHYPGGPGADASSLFGIGSITELLTAVATVRAGIDLDSSVSSYLPEFTLGGVGAEDVLVKHLLSHTSGLPFARRDSGPTDGQALERYVSRDLSMHRTLTGPGEMAIETPSGYNLAGRLLELAAGKPFDRLIRGLVLDAAGMTGASYPAAVDESRVVWPRSLLSDPSESNDHLPDDVSGHPSGHLYASLGDLIALATAILEGFLVDAATWAYMTRQHVSRRIDHVSYPLALAGAGYGLGCQVGVWNDQTVVRHTGLEASFHCTIELLPESASAAVIMTNGCEERTFNDLLNRCYETLAGRGRSVGEPSLEVLDDPIRRSWAGTYVQPTTGRRIEVENVEGDLVFRHAQGEAPLYYLGQGRATAPMEYGSAPIWFSSEGPPAHYLTLWGETYFRETVKSWEPPDSDEFAATFQDRFWPLARTDVTLSNESEEWLVTQGGDTSGAAALGERRLMSRHGIVELSEDGASLQVGNATVYHRS